jgi:hypothetical protein
MSQGVHSLVVVARELWPESQGLNVQGSKPKSSKEDSEVERRPSDTELQESVFVIDRG